MKLLLAYHLHDGEKGMLMLTDSNIILLHMDIDKVHIGIMKRKIFEMNILYNYCKEF